MDSPVTCPRCQAEAVNKYGRTAGGKQRYVCLVCGRQFVLDSPRQGMEGRPLCPVCGSTMHSYGAGKGFRRYRCSNYPECRGYARVGTEEGEQTCHINSQKNR